MSDLKIQTKDKRLIPFEPNRVQERYLDEICPGWRAGDFRMSGLREQILKARQFGFSTLIAALFFLDTYNNPNTNSVVIADNSDNTEALFRKVSTFYGSLDEDKKLPTGNASSRMMFWPDLGSTYHVLTAGNRKAGRSRTINNLHMSERPFWENDDILTGLLQTVPREGNIFDESTANGEGNGFHDDYWNAKEGKSTFTARFYAWFEHDEYQIPPPEGFTPDDKEQSLKTLHGVSDAQLAWRREKMLEPGMGSMFPQEYPSDDKEAFLVSGSKFFTEWDDARHCKFPSEVSIEPFWTYFGGFDWGFGAPCCFLLAAIDERGRVIIIDEMYKTRLMNTDQAQGIVDMLGKWGLPIDKVSVYADPSMWAKKVRDDGIGRADVEDFWAKGLRFVKANNNRQHGWTNFRQYLHQEGALTVLRGNCPNLIRTMPIQIHDKANVEDLDTDMEDHPEDAARYLLNSRPRPSTPPPGPVDHAAAARQQALARMTDYRHTPEQEHW